MTQLRVAAHLGIAKSTLQIHYRGEFDFGAEKANADISKNMYRIANTGMAAVFAAQYWLSCRACWRDT